MNENVKLDAVNGVEKVKKFYGEATVKIPIEVILPAFTPDDVIEQIMEDEALDMLHRGKPQIVNDEIEVEIVDEEDVE